MPPDCAPATSIKVGAAAVDSIATHERHQDSRLGLGLVSRTGAGGAWVESTSGPALLAGIEPGDQITAVNGMAVTNPADFDAAREGATGPVVALLVTRGPVMLYLAVQRQACRRAASHLP